MLTKAVKSLNVVRKSSSKLRAGEALKFDIEYELNSTTDVFIGLSVMYQGMAILEESTRNIKIPATAGKKHTVSYELPTDHFNSYSFKVNVSLFNSKNDEALGYIVDACNFMVISPPDISKAGPLAGAGGWRVYGTN